MAQGRQRENPNLTAQHPTEPGSASLRGDQVAEYRPDLSNVKDPAAAHALRLAYDYIYQLRGQIQPAGEKEPPPPLPFPNPMQTPAPTPGAEPACTPPELTLIQQISTGLSSANSVVDECVIVGDYLYLVGVTPGDVPQLQIWFVRYPNAMTQVGIVTLTAEVNYLYVQGHYAYCVSNRDNSLGSNSLIVVDVTDPNNPVQKADVSLGSLLGNKVFAQGKYVYVSGSVAFLGAFSIYDVSTPTAPTLVGTTMLPNDLLTCLTTKGIFAIGDYLYLTNEQTDLNSFNHGRLVIYNITNPAAPIFVAGLRLPQPGGVSPSTNQEFAEDVWVDGRYAYVCGDCSNPVDTTKAAAQMVVFDILEPTLPTITGFVRILDSQSQGVCFKDLTGQGDHIYIRGLTSPVQPLYQIDVTNRAAPFLLNQVDVGNDASGFKNRPSIQSRHVFTLSGLSTVVQLSSLFVGGFYCEEIQTAGLQIDGTASGDIARFRRGNFSGQVECSELTVAQGGNAAISGDVFSSRQVSGFADLTYGPTISTDARQGSVFRITITNNTAFTISNPNGPIARQFISYWVRNMSGGAAGALTFGSSFSIGAAWTQPANGNSRWIQFFFDGSNWIETFRSAADITNPPLAISLADNLGNWKDSIELFPYPYDRPFSDNLNQWADSASIETGVPVGMADDMNNWADSVSILLA